jgi:hypothetical protein
MQPTPPAASSPPAADPAALPAAPATSARPAAAQAVSSPPASADAAVARTAATPRPAVRTSADLAALRQQRKWLSDQLVSAQERRSTVARALENARDPVNQNGLQQRLQTLDQRIVQLESDISETGRLLTTAPVTVVAQSDVPRIVTQFDRGPGAGVVAIVFIACVLLPIVVTLCLRFVRRSGVRAPDHAARESADRLARLEQAIDAIAVEVERVSEGQRFVTRLLADSRHQTEQAPALHEYRPN